MKEQLKDNINFVMNKANLGLYTAYLLNTSDNYSKKAEVEPIASKEDAYKRFATAYLDYAKQHFNHWNGLNKTAVDDAIIKILQNLNDEQEINNVLYSLNKGKCVLEAAQDLQTSTDIIVETFNIKEQLEQLKALCWSHFFNQKSMEKNFECRENFKEKGLIDQELGYFVRELKNEFIGQVPKALELTEQLEKGLNGSSLNDFCVNEAILPRVINSAKEQVEYIINKAKAAIAAANMLQKAKEIEDNINNITDINEKNVHLKLAESYREAANEQVKIFEKKFALKTLIDPDLTSLLQKPDNNGLKDVLNYAANKGECFLKAIEKEEKFVEKIKEIEGEIVASKKYAAVLFADLYNQQAQNAYNDCLKEFQYGLIFDSDIQTAINNSQGYAATALNYANAILMEIMGSTITVEN